VAAAGDELDATSAWRGPFGGEAPLDRLFMLAIALCTFATLFVVSPGIHGHEILPTLDLVLDTIAAVVCATLTAMAWARFRERQVVAAAYHAGAFMALAVAYAIAVLVSVQASSNLAGLAAPENVQVLVFAVARLGAAILFVIAGIYTRRPTYGWNPAWILVAPTLAVLVSALVGRAFNPPPDALQIIVFNDVTGLPHITPFGAVIHLTTAVLFFIGAYVSRGLWHSGRAVLDGWIAVGLVFAGFAELQWTIYPSAHPGQVSTGDLLSLVCSACLLAGLASAFRASQRELRTANAELAELRDVEVEHAALEERTRLARELHDGLAQDLWLAKLRTGELLAMEGMPPEARRAAESAGAAIDVGLADAREAVATLRSSAQADSGFCTLIRRIVEDHGDRFGLRVEFTFEGDHDAHITPRTQAEILRIAQEALANVARHADATVVGVRLVVGDGRITLRVADNGHGFDVAAVGPDSYGLASMRERAGLIGGRLQITSEPATGTLVVLTAPFAAPETTQRHPARAVAQRR
jgi:signal transduction histidine kinase